MTTAAPESHAGATRHPGSAARRVWVAMSSALGTALGLAPHVLHHAGPLAGAALFAGVGGSLLFGALGILLAIPFLVRLRRRYGGWRIPLASLAIFAAVFSISTFVIGPAITGGDDTGASGSEEGQPTQDANHDAHH